MSKLVIIQIVNYNGFEYTGNLFIECIESVLKQTHKNIIIHMLDNHSTDESVRMVEELFPVVKISSMMKNWGYAAHNFGVPYFMYTNAEYLLIMNNDIILEEHCIENLLKRMEDDNIGAVMPLIHFLDKPDYINSAGIQMNYSAFSCNNGFNEPESKIDNIEETEILSGAAMLLRRDAVKKTGLFDIFLESYFEDADLCLRLLTETDYTTAVEGSAKCLHSYSSSYSRHAMKRDYLAMRNQYMLLLKLYPVYILFPALIYLFRTRLFKRMFLQLRVFISIFVLLPVILAKRMIHSVKSKRSLKKFLMQGFKPYAPEQRVKEYAIIGDIDVPDSRDIPSEIIFGVNDENLGKGFSYLTETFPQGRYVNSSAELYLMNRTGMIKVHGRGSGTFRINDAPFAVDGDFTTDIPGQAEGLLKIRIETDDDILFISIGNSDYENSGSK